MDTGLEAPDGNRPGTAKLAGATREGREGRLLPGVPGMLASGPIAGLTFVCVESLDGTRDPPLPPRLMVCPPTMLAVRELGAGEGGAETRLPMRLICART